MIIEAIRKTVAKESLSEQEAFATMSDIMSGQATDAQIGALMASLRMKGETVGEITGFARAMREFSVKVAFSGPAVDTCGTGGDVSGTFNVSTAVVFVTAGAGITVAKHGGRSVSSKCGSADLMELMGIDLELSAERHRECLESCGITFLFAPKMHPAMKYAAGPRKQLGIRSIFNILGPLTNPAGVKAQVMGVYSPELVRPIAEVLLNLGSAHAFVPNGSGLDEFTLTGKTTVAEVKDGQISVREVAPEDFGLQRCSIADVSGGDAARNMEILLDILNGAKGHRRNMVLLNAAAAIVAGGKAQDLKEGIKAAEESLDSGKALRKLEHFRKVAKKIT